MARYTPESIEQVKQAIDMVELVGARTDLRRVGSRWVGLCPFHDERTPSFSVNAEHGLYHCFGCEASGDAIRFVQESEALDFQGALELLAERYGVELQREQEDPRAEERRRRRERLLKLLDRATTFYARFLWDSAEAEPARRYLAERGLDREVLEAFRVGYAPKAWDRLVVAAQREGWKLDELTATGLAQRGRQGGFYDRFRGRITFPLADARGRVLGFGARALRPDQKPKYLNTSENELYHKGRQLFGLHVARGPAAKAGRIVVVEGYTDVLALHQAGIAETVAIMGTAFTQEHASELARVATTVLFALDADRSGQDATLRAARRAAHNRRLELLVVPMPEGADPADVVARDGAGGFSGLLEKAVSVPEFEIRRVLADTDLGSPRGRDLALSRVRPLVAETPERSATRLELVRLVADRLDVPTHYVMSPATQDRPQTPAAAPAAPAAERRAPAAPDLLGKGERIFLSLCLAEPVAGRRYLERLEDGHLSSDRLRAARDWLREHFDDPLAGLAEQDAALAAAVTEIAMRAEEEPSSEAVLELKFLELELRRVERTLRHAEREGDFDTQRELWGARERVRAEIDELMGEAV